MNEEDYKEFLKFKRALHQKVYRLSKKYPSAERQLSYHGAGSYSVQFFDKITGALVADYDL